MRTVDKSIRQPNSHLKGIAVSAAGSKGGAARGYGRWVLPAAGALLALATIAGALGAHALARRWSASRLNVYDVAVRYQFYQSLGLLAMGVLLRERSLPDPAAVGLRVVREYLGAPGALLAGIVLFCGSLYALSLGAPSVVGIVTPLGGVLLILGWVLFAYDTWRSGYR